MKKRKTPQTLAQPNSKWPGAAGPAIDPVQSLSVTDVLRRYPLEPTLIVSGDLTVEECASSMKEENVSAILISESPTSLDGMFTERDLFLKMNSKVAAEKIWTAPVRTVMSHPVITIEPELIHLAPALMADHRMHHLPVVMRNSLNQLCVLGLLTVDAIFQQNLKAASGFHDYVTSLPEVNSVGVLSDDKFMASQIVKTLIAAGNPMVRALRKAETMSPALLQAMAQGFQNLLIDVDGYDTKRLGRLLKLVLHSAKMKRVALIYSANAVDESMRDLLKQLAASPPFMLMPKPIEARELVVLFQSG